MSSELVSLAAATQIGLSLVAVAHSTIMLWDARSGHAALRKKLRDSKASEKDVLEFLDALSRAESNGVQEMLRVLESQSLLVALAIESLDRRKRKAVERALTQPSDVARKLYLSFEPAS